MMSSDVDADLRNAGSTVHNVGSTVHNAGSTVHNVGNAECAWDDFDPRWYVERNYQTLRNDDRRIIGYVRDHLTTGATGDVVEQAAGLDVGTGTNLAPTLLMLPFCRTVTLLEHAEPNLRWLAGELPSYSARWDPVWAELARHPAYRRIGDPRRAVATRTDLQPGSVFDLPRRSWGIGTMFYVAESITGVRAEFDAAMSAFLGALRPGAPFAVALMENSQGYAIDGRRFPAVPVLAGDVRAGLAPASDRLTVVRVEPDPHPLRNGYTGMLLATGWAATT